MNHRTIRTSRQKILLGCFAMLLAMIGDYLMGFGTFGFSSAPDAYMGIEWTIAPDWRYSVSAFLGFACMPFFAVAAVELMRVMEEKYKLAGDRFYRLFKIANWSGILYFAFIHVGICMLPVVFNAGMEATGDIPAAVGMTFRVLKSIAVPMVIGFLACDLLVLIGWAGMIIRGRLPLKKAAIVCTPVITALAGQLMNYVAEGADSGFESLGWLLMYLVCALKLTDGRE